MPTEIAIAAITLAELAAGPHAAGDPDERARRQDRLQRAETTFDALPFDDRAARAYGRIYARVTSQGARPEVGGRSTSSSPPRPSEPGSGRHPRHLIHRSAAP